MERIREKIKAILKETNQHLSEDEVNYLLDTLETYCELVINNTLNNSDIEEEE